MRTRALPACEVIGAGADSNATDTIKAESCIAPSKPSRTKEYVTNYRVILAIVYTVLLTGLAPVQAQPQPRLRLEMCNNRPNTGKKTCVVDGDTLWLSGENIRLRDFDTPEPQSSICGGSAEVTLAKRASARLLELLNSNEWAIERFGYDSTSSKRRLATISIDGRDVGDILIEERLARQRPDGDEWWCS